MTLRPSRVCPVWTFTVLSESLMGNSMGSLRSSTATQAGPKGASGDKGEPGRPGDRGEKVSQRAKTTLVQ